MIPGQLLRIISHTPYRIHTPTCPERDKNLIFSPFFLGITMAKKHQSKSKPGGLAAPPATLDQKLKGSKLAGWYFPESQNSYFLAPCANIPPLESGASPGLACLQTTPSRLPGGGAISGGY